MTDNQKTELEEAIVAFDGQQVVALLDTRVTAKQLQTLVDAAKKYAELSDYILIRRDDVPEGLKEATDIESLNFRADVKTLDKLTDVIRTARLVQAAMEDK